VSRHDPEVGSAPAPPSAAPPATDNLVGLALSGGGVRSATFALGGLQALHRLELLPIFDYLSTVSGGGFTGGWWSAWLSRPERPEPAQFPDAEDIEPSRRPSTLLGAGAQTSPGPAAGGPGAQDPIHHLRLFANYLTPRCGALSADTWRAVTFYVRSLIFNWLALLPLLLAVVMAGQLYYLAWDDDVARGFVCSLPDHGEASGDGAASKICPPGGASHSAVVWTRASRALAPLVILLAAMAAVALLWLLHGTSAPSAAVFGLLVLSGFSAYLVSIIRGSTPGAPGSLWSVPRMAFLAVALITLAHLWSLLTTPRVGGRIPHDTHRTRLAQWNSGLLLATVLLGLVLGVAGFGHEIVWFFFYPSTGHAWSMVLQAGGWAAIAAAALSAGWTAYQAAPSGRAKDSAEPPGRTTRVVFMLAPYLVVGVLMLLLAVAGRSVIVAVSGRTDVMRALSYGVIAGAIVQLVFAFSELWRRRLPGLNHRVLGLVALAIAGGGSQTWALSRLGEDGAVFVLGPLTVTLILLAVAAVVGLGWMSDPNVLSMHSFYKARLVRAYLGASNPDRRGAQITDAVPGDDLQFRALCNHDRGAPYHLVNTTLNLVASADLATAQRSAANFVLASYYCGSARTGYRLTEEYMGGELTLGTALAISGAAASPNMGSRTPSMPLVMLLALVNARLGFWAPTPVGARWREPRAALWPFYLLREALSQTTDLTTYCYLSDGGHFDNTGIYALVERGCRYIVLFDSGADPGPCFADLGGAIRRCRIDFGAEVDLGVQGLLDQTDGLATRQVVVGRVRYRKEHWDTLGLGAQSDADRTGIIVWVKPAVTTADAGDVRQYKLQNPLFPHQTTMDQWYDEAQFESYRKLGYDSVFSALRPCLPPPGPLGAGRVQALFQNLEAAYP
jgi:hypothetical protein